MDNNETLPNINTTPEDIYNKNDILDKIKLNDFIYLDDFMYGRFLQLASYWRLNCQCGNIEICKETMTKLKDYSESSNPAVWSEMIRTIEYAVRVAYSQPSFFNKQHQDIIEMSNIMFDWVDNFYLKRIKQTTEKESLYAALTK